MRNLFILFILTLSLFIVGCSTNNSSNLQSAQNDNNIGVNTQTNVQTTLGSTKTTISLSELKKHSTESNCWIAYEGVVYDITPYLEMRPANSPIISLDCGTSDQFESNFIQKYNVSEIHVLEAQGLYKGLLE